VCSEQYGKFVLILNARSIAVNDGRQETDCITS
jgi:hypothetical protein